MNATDKDFAARIVGFMLEAIAEAGAAGLPDGHLFATMQMGLGAERWPLHQHNGFIASLVQAGIITREHHVLRLAEKQAT